jgi:hypothetical protein
MHWVGRLSIGVATMGNKEALFVTLMNRVPRFEVHWSQLFCQISKSGDFYANDDMTDYFTACACACTRGSLAS